jgi:hypothetical protein
MTALNYSRDGAQILMRQAWEIISDDLFACQKNLTSFITAIENIPYFPIIKPVPLTSSSINDSLSYAVIKKKFGYFSDGTLYMQSESEVKKIS